MLFDDLPRRDYRAVRVNLRREPTPDNPWLAWALHLAYRLAEVRGWQPTVRSGIQRTLVQVLAQHTAGETIRASDVSEVTHDDVLTWISGLRGEALRSTVTALRSLFGWARRSGVVFRNPASGIRLGKRVYPVWQPLAPADTAAVVAAASTPHARVFVALAAIHAARPGQIRSLQLTNVDLAGRRLRIAGHERPLDDLTYEVLRGWLAYRAGRWPNTANPHLLVSQQSALGHGPVSHAWVLNLRGLRGTVERLRIDRQLEEALTVGFDPLHLATVFGIAERTAIRYAINARQLLQGPCEATDSVSPGNVNVRTT